MRCRCGVAQHIGGFYMFLVQGYDNASVNVNNNTERLDKEFHVAQDSPDYPLFCFHEKIITIK